MTIYDELRRFGMNRFACVNVGHEGEARFFRVVCSGELAEVCFGVYAFVVGDCVVRVGKAEQKLKSRMASYTNSVTRSLNYRNLERPGTPYWEADAWWTYLSRCGTGVVYGKAGSVRNLGFGEMNIFEAEERLLIMRYAPLLHSENEVRRAINWFPLADA